MTSEQETLRSGMEDTQLTQNNSPAAGPVVAKTSDGLHLSVQTYGQVGNDEILFIHGFGQSRLSPELEFFTQRFGELLPRLASLDLSERATATADFLASCFSTKPEAGAFGQMLVAAGMMPLVVTQGLLNVSGAGLDEAFTKSGPMLVTYGGADLLFEPTMSTRMQALNEEAQLSLYPESGHAPFYDEPERFNRELAAFISDRHSRTRAPSVCACAKGRVSIPK
jgi:hypothetical protein